MKQQIIRKTLTGNWEFFDFGVKGSQFLVKNFSDAAIYVSFAANDSENESIKILAKGFQVCAIMGDYVEIKQRTKGVYVKGTGEVEVQYLCQ